MCKECKFSPSGVGSCVNPSPSRETHSPVSAAYFVPSLLYPSYHAIEKVLCATRDSLPREWSTDRAIVDGTLGTPSNELLLRRVALGTSSHPGFTIDSTVAMMLKNDGLSPSRAQTETEFATTAQLDDEERHEGNFYG